MDLKTLGSKRGTRKNHKKGIAGQMLDAKRSRALARQAEYDKLTIAERIAKLDVGGFVAAKQRARLAKLNVAKN